MSKKAFLMDDQWDMRLLIKNILVKAGWECIEITGERDLDSKMWEMVADLMIVDQYLRWTHFTNMINILRTRPEHRATPVLLTMVDPTEEDIAEALSAGVKDYIRMPFSDEQLLAKIKQLST